MANKIVKQDTSPKDIRTDTSGRVINPLADICEEEGSVLVRLEMPGVEKADLDIQVEGSQLRIQAEKPQDDRPQGRYVLRERPVGRYAKTYTLDETIDPDKITATMSRGVLTLELGMKEAVKPRKIKIA